MKNAPYCAASVDGNCNNCRYKQQCRDEEFRYMVRDTGRRYLFNAFYPLFKWAVILLVKVMSYLRVGDTYPYAQRRILNELEKGVR